MSRGPRVPGRRLALAIAIACNLLLLWASVNSVRVRSCGPDPDRFEPMNLVLGVVLIGVLVGPGHLLHVWLARRLWSRGPFAQFVCLLPPLVMGVVSMCVALAVAFVSGTILC